MQEFAKEREHWKLMTEKICYQDKLQTTFVYTSYNKVFLQFGKLNNLEFLSLQLQNKLNDVVPCIQDTKNKQ